MSDRSESVVRRCLVAPIVGLVAITISGVELRRTSDHPSHQAAPKALDRQ